MVRMSNRRPEWIGFFIGLLVAASVTFACFRIFGRSIDRPLYDFRVRRLSTIPASEKIVHIDIDDSALEEVGRWPWRRQRLAQLIGIAHELGAACIVVDLLLSEEEPYYVPEHAHPKLYRDGDIDPDLNLIRETEDASDLPVVAGDEELSPARAMSSWPYSLTRAAPAPPGLRPSG